jgi:predicted HAD superfamily Cof-like phosphohydrolase
VNEQNGQRDMASLRARVMAFHTMIGQPSPEVPAVPADERVRLRARLITEEYFELMHALLGEIEGVGTLEAQRWIEQLIDESKPKADIVAVADACADLAYVVEGTNLEFGINGDEILTEVHGANMAKASGPMREDGKRLKPAGWTPPDIAGVLRRQGWTGG